MANYFIASQFAVFYFILKAARCVLLKTTRNPVACSRLDASTKGKETQITDPREAQFHHFVVKMLLRLCDLGPCVLSLQKSVNANQVIL